MPPRYEIYPSLPISIHTAQPISEKMIAPSIPITGFAGCDIAVGLPAFGFNYDPSHLGYQGVDYVDFIYQFPERIFHVHMKDVYWSDTPKQVGIFGGHVTFGDPRRYWNFRSLGRGKINFEEIIRALNSIGYQGPLSVEWEDSAMDREHGARESCELEKRVDFQPSAHAFDACFGKE